MKRIAGGLVFLALTFLLLWPVTAAVASVRPAEILILHSYHYELAWSRELQRGIETAIAQAGLTANFRLQFGGDTADGQCRVIHFVGFNQMGKSLCLIQHSIDVLRRRQILRFPTAWHEAHLLAFGDMLDDQRSRLALNFTG